MTPSVSSEVFRLDALDVVQRLRTRQLSCVELMDATLKRIDALNPTFNAIVARRSRDECLAEARTKDSGPASGALFGLPLAVKDLAAVKGIPMTMGSPLLQGFVPSEDSVFVERLRAAGAIIIGKTNTPEFGLGSQTFNPVYGATRNAYDPALTAGGSSGGAAVALALRMVALSDGSDYGGSLRNPAGWNGVYGFRPSIGRVPSDGREAWLPSMAVNGPMARNPADLALLLSVMAGYDQREPLSLAGDGREFAAPIRALKKGLRIAWAADWNGALPCEDGVLAVCEHALKVLERLGCVVEPAIPDLSFDELWEAFVRLRHWQASADLLPFWNDPAKRKLLKPEAQWEVECGSKLTAFDISAASSVRTRWTHTMQRFLGQYDFLVLPTAQVFPFSVETRWPASIAGRAMGTYHEWMKCVVPATMMGGPTLAAPAGFGQRGLPMGIQIIGPNRAELDCLSLAAAYHEAARPDLSESRFSV
jgi:amidase